MLAPTRAPSSPSKQRLAPEDPGAGRASDCQPEGEATLNPLSGPVAVLLVTADHAFARHLGQGLADSAEIALTIGHPPDVRTRLDQLAAQASAQVVVADAALLATGAIDPSVHEAHAHGHELVLLFPQVTDTSFDEVQRSHARGCIEPGLPLPVFVHAMRAVAQGELWLPRWMLEIVYEQALAGGLAAPRTHPGSVSPRRELTPREVEVLQLVKAGLTNKEVARQLDITASTVKKHLHSALAKRGLFRRRQAFAADE
jgi:DNA-binding NarL/FixJ family response regulator